MVISTQRLQLGLSYLISLSILLGIVVSVVTQQWFNAFLGALAFVLTYIPALIQKNLKVIIPIEFEILVTVFVYASIFLGSIHGYYITFWWWDLFLHTVSGMLLGMVGFLMVYVLNSERRFLIRLSPLYVSIVSFSFALALGALWEIFEFGLDLFFDLGMQDGSLVDTMSDLIVDALGGLFVAVSGGLYVKKIRVPIFDRLMDIFVKKNPQFFK